MIKKINPRFCLKPNEERVFLKGSQLLINSHFLKHILIKALGDNFKCVWMINSNSNKSQKMNQRVESLDKAIDVIRAVEIYTTELKNIDLKELNHFMCNHE